jgi:hypothetical protein
MRRHEVKLRVETPYRPLEEWGKLIRDVLAPTAIIDRSLHVVQIMTRSDYSHSPQ